MPVSHEERTVVLGEAEPEKAVGVLGAEGGTRLSDVAEAIPVFKNVSFNGFKAEYSLAGDDLVIHFFLPSSRKVTEWYWKDGFAGVLNEVGQEHFQATKPRLVAKYTEEMQSWWLKAQGYGYIIDRDAFVKRFFEKMDEKLGPLLASQSRVT